MPNGRRLKQKRPNGVMKVVSFWLSSVSGTCQKPCLASSTEKTCAPEILPRTSSQVGMANRSLETALLSWRRSTHSRIFPFFFGAMTMGEHQSVGSLMRWTIPCVSSCFSSSLSWGMNGMGIRRGAFTQYVVASSAIRMVTGWSYIQPGPSKTLSWLMSV